MKKYVWVLFSKKDKYEKGNIPFNVFSSKKKARYFKSDWQSDHDNERLKGPFKFKRNKQ